MADQFAIITFRNTGPIKTWSDMRAANVHNARTKPLAHAMPGAAPPEHLIGGSDLVADVKQHLRAARLDPDRLRKNGVIAYEAILSASAGFFDAGTSDEQGTRLRAWKVAQRDWALQRYGAHRVASMVLHTDEKVPHIHLVVVPLEVKADGRRKDQDERWTLVGRSVSGPGKFEEVQDAYAVAMAPFGLVRGVRSSGRKHEPVPVYLARMAAKEREADELRVALIRERDALAAERVKLDRIRADMARDQRLVLNASSEAKRRNLAAWRERTEVERIAREVLRERAAWTEERNAAEADLASRQARSAQFREDLVASREKLVPIVAAAKEFVRAAAGRDPKDIVPEVRPAIAAARQVMDACRVATAPTALRQQVIVSGILAGR